MDEFTSDEKQLLSRFCTNTDRQVFALVNLPEVVKGALFSRYSRSPKTLRRLLLDEFINAPEMAFKDIVSFGEQQGASQAVATQKAEEFYDRVLVGYGDDSVGELGGAHIAVEGVSNIAAKVLEDSRVGISPLEKSTRYIYFDKQENGKYLYYEEPTIMASRHAELYKKTNDLLFSTYAKLIEPMKKYIMERFPMEEGVSERAYTATIRAKVCDVLRGFLPAATLTNVGMFGNGRAFEYMLTKMYSSEMKEMQLLSATMQEELSKAIPSFVKRANDKYGQRTIEYMRETRKDLRRETAGLLKGEEPQPSQEVTLVEFDDKAEAKVVAAILYEHSSLPLSQIRSKVAEMPAESRSKVLSDYLSRRENRRHKAGRALEQVYYTFDLLGNYGIFRDLHRHRMLSQQRQELTVAHGYDTAPEMVDTGFGAEFDECMKAAADAYNLIANDFPREAQYVVPFAYRIRWYAKMNAREAIHFTELRSMRQGHPDYRRMAQEMYRQIWRVHPAIAAQMKFVDLQEHGLERLEAEKRLDQKMDEMEKKYGQA